MKKLASALVLSMGLLASCGGEKPDVVNLSYVDAHWTVNKYAEEKLISLHSADETLQACTGELTTELKGDLTVFDTIVANRYPMTDTGEEYAFKAVSYMKGDENYAICRDMASNRFSAQVIESFPDDVDVKTGTPINRYPVVGPADDSAKTALRNADELNESGNPIEPFLDTLVAFSPALYGEIELKVGGMPSPYPLFSFDPSMAGMTDIKLAIGYDKLTEKPYLLLMFADLYFSVTPLESMIDPTTEGHTYEGLTVERLPLETELVPDKTYPLYEFSYTRDGKVVNETMAFNYRTSDLLSTAERKKLETQPEEDYMPLVTGPLVYLHQQPFNTDSPLSHPVLLKAAGNEMDDLVQAIDSAEPTNRSGDEGDYRYLTIVDGHKGQEFEVTYKQRSKKLDIYVTDRSTEETYKLTSEGAETFLSYFPDLKKK